MEKRNANERLNIEAAMKTNIDCNRNEEVNDESEEFPFDVQTCKNGRRVKPIMQKQ